MADHGWTALFIIGAVQAMVYHLLLYGYILSKAFKKFLWC